MACAFPGVADIHHVCLPPEERDGYACGLKPGWSCAPGYFDVEDRPGCECVGRSADDCQPCGLDDLPHTGIDEDCDLRIDEGVRNRERRPWPPNGPLGALPDDPEAMRTAIVGPAPVSRAACGASSAVCALPADADDVRCVRDEDDGAQCRAVHADEAPVATTGRALVGAEVDCTDGVDDDGNGIVDDGPTCQTLVPSVSTPECHGRTGAEGCPPAYVSLAPEHLRLWGSEKPLVARMHYDILVDNAEATRGQVRRFLDETGRCDRPPDERHPLCDDTGDPALPAGGLDWCAAYAYCQWAGKRVPTELEWLRAFGGTTGGVEAGESCADGANSADCEASGPRPVGRTGGHAAKGMQGESVITDALGNVAEWVYDAHLAPCEAPWADCSGPTPFAVDLPDDPALPAPPGDPRRPRLLRGGGWAGELGAASVERRQFADPGAEVAHYGVRCVQTFRPLQQSLPGLAPIEEVPYRWTAEAEAHAECKSLPATQRLARRTVPYRLNVAVEACVRGAPELDDVVTRALAGPTPLLVSVTDEGGGAATMGVETGLVPGAEAFWLAGRAPTLTLIERGCTPSGCRFDRSTEPGVLTLAFRLSRADRVPLHGMRPIAGAIPTCLSPTPFGERAWRLDLRLPEASIDGAFDSLNPRKRACATLRCADPVDEDACVRDCQAWKLPVDVQMRRLIVP